MGSGGREQHTKEEEKKDKKELEGAERAQGSGRTGFSRQGWSGLESGRLGQREPPITEGERLGGS